MFRSWRQSVRELGERVERLEGELGRLNMENADLKSQLKERDARIAKLESVLEESRRAGKRQAAPFSKDKPKRDPKKPGRKPGSKYGRQAVRAIPVPDKTFEAPCPEQCPCGGKVGAEGSIDLYQVDIPPIQPETWKFVVGHGHCQECGRRVRGQHPLLISKAFEVGTVHFGPRLLAFAAFQKMICGVSYDKIRLGFEQMLGFPVARSTLCRAMQRLARRAKPTRDALVEALRASPVVYADETGWKQGGRRVWLWVFTNLRETVYEILPGRGFEQAASVLGKNYAGTLGVDGWAPYRCFKEATLQTCYNHLLHRCHELLETATRGAVRFPRLVKAILRHALALRDRRDAGEISPHGLRVAKGLLQAKMNRLLHGRFTNPANQRFAKHLRRYRDNLFVFLDRADVEATNYPAEQDIRIAVVNRKTCGGGNRTAKGAQAQSILMSVLQNIDGALEWMRRAYEQTYFNENEERAWLLTQVAHLERSRGAIGAAEEAAENALELFPDYHYALAELAHIRMGQGKSDEAVSLFEARYRLAPHPENLYDLAKAKRRAGRRREAVDLFSEFERLALRESEANDNANRELVFYYADVANDSSAALGIARLASGRRQDVFTLDAYAWALFRSGSAEEAWEQMETALAPGIQDAKFLYHAGCIRAALADSERATRYWERSLRLDPYSEVAAAAKRALDEHGPTAGN